MNNVVQSTEQTTNLEDGALVFTAISNKPPSLRPLKTELNQHYAYLKADIVPRNQQSVLVIKTSVLILYRQINTVVLDPFKDT